MSDGGRAAEFVQTAPGGAPWQACAHRPPAKHGGRVDWAARHPIKCGRTNPPGRSVAARGHRRRVRLTPAGPGQPLDPSASQTAVPSFTRLIRYDMRNDRGTSTRVRDVSIATNIPAFALSASAINAHRFDNSDRPMKDFASVIDKSHSSARDLICIKLLILKKINSIAQAHKD